MLQLLTREALVAGGKLRSERPTLSMTWTLDPHTGKPVGRWIVEGTEPATLPLSSAA
jgi:hypothetical protein